MRIAVVGRGHMGREVDAVLRERGHEPVPVGRQDAFPAECSVGIDFTQAEAVVYNVRVAMSAGARYVVGTTGWDDSRDEVRRIVQEAEGGLVYAANFSLGVQLFYRCVRHAAGLMARFPEYDPYILERHHRRKRDAPSGTARALASILESQAGSRTRAVSDVTSGLTDDAFHVAAVRAGGIVGDHTVGFDSGGDEILFEHRARTRRGFALGSVLAAEWIATHTGFHSFDTVIEDLLEA